jgi:hypothetical protein
VVLTAQGVQDALENAVTNGKLFRHDAEELARGLLETGRRQSQQLIADVEDALGIPASVSRAEDAVDRVHRAAERARRRAGIG